MPKVNARAATKTAKRVRKARRTESKQRRTPHAFRETSKMFKLVSLLKSRDGVKIGALVRKLGWTPTTVRGAISVLKVRSGYHVQNVGERGEPIYQIK